MASVYSDVFVPYLVRLTTSGSPVILDGVLSQDIDPGVRRDHRRGASRRYPTVSTLAEAARMGLFSTVSIDTLLGISGILAGVVPIGSAFTHTALNMHEAKMAHGGHFASGNVHRTNVMSNALLTLLDITCVQDPSGRISAAVAELDILPVTDGTNDPLSVSVSQALPTLGDEVGYFALGPITVNGSTEDLVTGWSYKPNIERGAKRAGGQKYPRIAFDRGASPTLDIVFGTSVPLSTYGLDGGALPGALVLYLVKCDPSGARVAAATEEHIAFNIPKGTITPIRASGRIGSDMMSGVHVELLQNATDAIITVDTTAALPS